jgi:hypothetical protein
LQAFIHNKPLLKEPVYVKWVFVTRKEQLARYYLENTKTNKELTMKMKLTMACLFAVSTYCMTTFAADTKAATDVTAEKQKIASNIAKTEAKLAKVEEFNQKQSKIIAQFKSCINGAENMDAVNACKASKQNQLRALSNAAKNKNVAAQNGDLKQAAAPATTNKTSKN